MATPIVRLAMILAVAAPLGAQVPAIELHRGLVITHSVRIAPKVYRIAGRASLDSAAITIRGDDVTVDFAGATLEGIAGASYRFRTREGSRPWGFVNVTFPASGANADGYTTRTLTLPGR